MEDKAYEKPRDWEVIEAMKRFGGSFVQLLGRALEKADDQNLRRAKLAWPEYWAKYEMLAATRREGDRI